jgi:hypothetical protein
VKVTDGTASRRVWRLGRLRRSFWTAGGERRAGRNGKMSMSRRRTRVAVLSVMVVIGGVLATARAEEHAVRIQAPWEGRVRVYVTGPQQAFALGVFSGRLAADPESSTLQGAGLVCPGVFDADYAASTQRGEGRCVITSRSGDRFFARWTCTGEPDKGCTGKFVLTGGTGAYEGVTGEGDLSLRLTLSDLTRLNQLESDYDVKGLATWPALRYRTP